MGLNVLVVAPCNSDWRIIAKGIRCELAVASVLRVVDGVQAIRFMIERGLLTEEPEFPDILVIDLALPMLPAQEVLARVHENAVARSTQIIALTEDPDCAAIAGNPIGIAAVAIKYAGAQAFEASFTSSLRQARAALQTAKRPALLN
jgi:CheY-like chemotaxis protein